MQLNKQIFSNYKLTPQAVQQTMGCYTPLELKANQFFLKEGRVCDKIGYVIKGLLRAYFRNEEGDETTTQFFTEGSLIISFESFNNQVPAKENIVGVTDAALMVITYKKQKELYELIPEWNLICKDLADIKSREMAERAIQFQTMTATERYRNFCREQPAVLQMAPLGHIASYLGIDIATLSRIRRKKDNF